MQTCEHCKQKDRQLALIQAELHFQIKKLNEDMAHQKLTLQMAHQKETKKLIDKANYSKQERELENQIWMKKYDTMAHLYDDKLKKAKEDHQKQMEEVKAHMAKNEHLTCQQLEQRWKQQINELKQENAKECRRIALGKEDQKKHIIRIYQEEILKLAQKHEQQLNNIREENQRREDVILNYHQSERSLLNTTAAKEEQISQHKQQISSFKEKIKQLQNKIQYMEYSAHKQAQHLQEQKIQHKAIIAKLKEEFQSQTQRAQQEFNSKVSQLIQGEFNRCQQYQLKLKQLQQLRQTELRLHQQSIDYLKTFSQEKYVPKEQFHHQISTLQVRLSTREHDIQKAKQQIKQCKLQIENNDDLLTKFFRSSNHQTAPDIFVHTPQNKKKDYKIKKNRSSMGASFLDVGKSSTKVSSMQSLDKHTHLESFRML